MNKFPLLFLLLLMLASCGSHKKMTRTQPLPPPIKQQEAITDIAQMRQVLENSIPTWRWLRSKGTVHYEKKDQKINANISLKERQDSVVWASINVLIEAARGLVTEDSAYVMNRTSKEYMVFPVSGLEGLLGVPGLNLHALQSLLMGLPPFSIADGTTMAYRDSTIVFERKTPQFLESYALNAHTNRLKDYQIEKNATQQVTIQYSDYTQVGKLILPKKIDLTITSPDKILITLEIADYTLLETDEAPFTIPASYTRVH